MPSPRSCAVLVLLLGSAGCSLSRMPVPDAPTAWVAHLGGPGATVLMPRIEAAAELLAAAAPRRLRFLVTAHGRVGAWSWPDGSVVVSERLLRELPEDELVAVLAHELGHLELDARSGRRALSGSARSLAVDEAADRAGSAILARCGFDAALMPRMLRHVATVEGVDTAAGRAALERAARLEHR